MTPRTIVVGAVIDAMPGQTRPSPILASTWPLMPKLAHGRPVAASTAISRASTVASITRGR
ncbi:MAG TPA: hypothetical protein VLM18_06135 [Croceibacterium sp.]|nr:hypothetical protein [Croceibacterium sp.]